MSMATMAYQEISGACHFGPSKTNETMICCILKKTQVVEILKYCEVSVYLIKSGLVHFGIHLHKFDAESCVVVHV